MEAFLSAIRSKPNWPSKVLDEDRNLCEKWIEEGKLEQVAGLDRVKIDASIRELKQEARKILACDSLARLTSVPSPPVDTADWAQIGLDVQGALDEVNTSIQAPQLGDVCGVRTADNFIPASLHRVLETELDNFAKESEIPDYHPKSDGKVLDVLHPSLYPYCHGRTVLPDDQAPKGDGFNTWTRLHHFHPDDDEAEPVEHSSKFAWLPSVFRVSPTGDSTRILSYINNLGPRSAHPALYTAIEHLFTLALPMIQQSMDEDFVCIDTPSYQRWEERAEGAESRYADTQSLTAWRDNLAKQKEQERAGEKFQRREAKIQPEVKGHRPPVDLRGKDVKVIVKVAEYHLKPGQEYTGSWHIEGAPHEMIAASFIYYLSTSDEIEDDGLSLRRVRLECDVPNMEEHHGNTFSINFHTDDGVPFWNLRDPPTDAPNFDFPSDWESNFHPSSFSGAVPLGVVPTTGVDDSKGGTGRMLSFPNWVQHQVKGLRRKILDPPSELEVAKRKILCFFVVREDRDESNPDTLTVPGLTYESLSSLPPVITTAQVPPQQHLYTFPATYFWLSRACQKLTNRSLPIEIFVQIFRDAAIGMGREEAERVRREVMEDRGMLKGKEEEAWVGSFGLCEH